MSDSKHPYRYPWTRQVLSCIYHQVTMTSLSDILHFLLRDEDNLFFLLLPYISDPLAPRHQSVEPALMDVRAVIAFRNKAVNHLDDNTVHYSIHFMIQYIAKHTHTRQLCVASGLPLFQRPWDADIKLHGHLKQYTMVSHYMAPIHNEGTWVRAMWKTFF